MKNVLEWRPAKKSDKSPEPVIEDPLSKETESRLLTDDEALLMAVFLKRMETQKVPLTNGNLTSEDLEIFRVVLEYSNDKLIYLATTAKPKEIEDDRVLYSIIAAVIDEKIHSRVIRLVE